MNILYRRCTIAALILFFSTAAGLRAQDDAAQAFPKEQAVRALTTGTETSRQAALDQLQTQYADQPQVADVLVEVLQKQVEKRGASDSTLRMISMLGKYHRPEAVDLLVRFLASANEQAVMAAADALVKQADPKALDPLVKLAERKEFDSIYGFRKCVMKAVMAIPDRRSIDFLMEQLPKLEGQLLFDVVRHLSSISPQRFGDNAEHWITWWKDNREDFQFPGAASGSDDSSQADYIVQTGDASGQDASLSEDLGWSTTVPEFYGIRIYAKRIVFIIDRSSSMRAATAGGGSRLDQAKRELIGAIQAVPEDAYFAIVTFDANTREWPARGMIEATPANKERAVRFVSYITSGHGTASYDALVRGFAVDGNTDAIFFLSDGRPSKGKIVDPPTIVRTITRKNFMRRIAIYTIGIGDAGDFMRDLARRNGGAYKGVQ